jgi:hypothetical protein
MSRESLLQFIKKVIEITTMRKDSCRNCGVTMQEFQHCTVCNIVNQFVCSHCRRATDEQVHLKCDLMTTELILN